MIAESVVSENALLRKLTTILYADVAGYSRLTGLDEELAHRAVMGALDFTHATVEERGGTVLRRAGDAILAEFTSVVSCVHAAVVVQTELARRNQEIPESQRALLRIGINLGEVVEDRGEIYGDGVNVAARLEGFAPPGGICVSGQVAKQIAGKTDVRFGNAGRQRFKNITAPVEVWCWPADHAPKMRRAGLLSRRAIAVGLPAALSLIAALYLIASHGDDSALPSGPRIAVLPFEELGSGASDGYFSAGLTKDINAYLAKFTNLFVFAPSSVANLSGADCNEIREVLAGDYVLEGSVRRSLDKVRITTTLTDAMSCRQLNSPGPYDRDLAAGNIIDIQLDIAKKVAAELGSSDAPLFNARIQKAIRGKAPDSLEAYDCVLLSYWFYENFDPNRHRRARACLESATRTEPDYSLGWSRLAFSYIESKKYAIDTPDDWAQRAEAAAERAISFDPDNPDAYYALAILTQMTSRSLSEYQSHARRAVELNPNDAFVLADLGTWMGYAGQWETAKDWVSRAMQLNPNHQSWMWQTWHLHHFLEGKYAKSRDVALRMNLPGNYMVQASLTAAYAMNGEQKKAEEALAHLLELRPDYPNDPRAPFRSRGMPSELIEGLMEGLRRAGLDVKPAEKEK